MNWRGRSIRFTLFPHGDWDPTVLNLWPSFGEGEPETDEIRPREKARRQAGPYQDNIQLNVQIAPARIDVFFAVNPTAPGQPEVFSEPVNQVLKDAVVSLSTWIPTAPFQVSRAALGLELFEPVPDRIAGYHAVLSHTRSLKFEPRESISDLVFQINRPAKSSVINGPINRIMKYSVVMFNLVTITGMTQRSLAQSVGATEFFSRLELDINTVPSDQQLDQDKLASLFDELANMAMEIADNGEPE